MLTQEPATRLRRPAWAWFLGVHGQVAFFLVVSALSMHAYLYLLVRDALLFVPVVVCLALLLFLLGTRVVLFEDRFESGHRFFPKSIDRSNIVDVSEGKVLWGRGYLTGVVLILDDNSSAPIAGSAPLSKTVRQRWIADIRVWIEADDDHPGHR